jgi:hypothetical protein
MQSIGLEGAGLQAARALDRRRRGNYRGGAAICGGAA